MIRLTNNPEGFKQLMDSTIAICGLARNCQTKLPGNIRFIESLCTYFQESNVVVVENESKDATRKMLNNWADSSRNVRVLNGDIKQNDLALEENKDTVQELRNKPFNEQAKKGKVVTSPNPYYSLARISRMASLRNQYLEYLENLNKPFDYLLVLDFDVDRISLSGVLNSLFRNNEWDVVTAYGYSIGPSFRERYHDTYALVPLGEQEKTQNEVSIKALQLLWKLSKKDEILKPVYAAYGGLSIYKYPQIASLRYQLIPNQDLKVEVRCEHFSICNQLQKAGKTQIMVNPMMHLRYQSIWEGAKTFFSEISLIR